jgi:hypothetical protein
MRKTAVIIALAIAASAFALDHPRVPDDISSGPYVVCQRDRDQLLTETRMAPSTIRAALEQMSPAERANARISVEFESSDDEAVSLGRQVERLWNGGQYDEALAQLGNLEARVGMGRVAIGNSWRTPVPTFEADLWESDVRIGNRDSLLELAFDTELASGNLFVVLRSGGGPPHYSVCMSADGGATWDETFTWIGSPPTSLDAAVCRSHLHVVYNSPGENAQQVRLRRFRCSTGLADTFRNGRSWVASWELDSGDTMKEASLVSNQHDVNSRLYFAILVSDGSTLLGWDYANAMSWTKLSTGITSGASSGLDATENQESDSTWVFFSYYDASDTLRIYRWGSGGIEQRFSRFTGTGTPTSISAYRDTVICAYEDGTSSPHQVRYVTNYGDGDTWAIGTLSNADTTAESPGVAARGGGGFAAVFRHCAPTRELRFRRRAYDGPWSDPVSIADNEPYWNRPGIEYLGAGVFGVVYLSNANPVVRGAYFDRSDWPYGLAEQRRLIVDERILSVAPSPLTGHGRLNYTLNRPADLRVQVYDRAGRIVRTLFHGHSPAGRQSLGFDARGMAPGVYFVRADADGRALTVPTTIVR